MKADFASYSPPHAARRIRRTAIPNQRNMTSIITLFIVATIFAGPLAASPRLLPRVDDPSLELMECGHLLGHPREPPLRTPHRAGTELIKCRPLTQQDSRSSSLAGNPDSPAGPRLSSSSHDDITIDSSWLPSSPSQQQLDSALVRPISQSMESEIEMANFGLLDPGHTDFSAPNGTSPAPALGTGTAPSRAMCMQCVQSCLGPFTNATEAVGRYCATSRDSCGRDEAALCTVIGLSCCTYLAVAYDILST